MPRPTRPIGFGALAVAVALSILSASACSSDGTVGAGGSEGGRTGTTVGAEVVPTGAVKLLPVATLSKPIALAPRPGTADLYIAEQGGLVRRLTVSAGADGTPGYAVDPHPVLDLTATTRPEGERGLLGLTFDPTGTKAVVDYTDLDGHTNVVEYTMAGDIADPGTARRLLFIEQPFPNHNGGNVVYGPDGFLYIGMGDGGGQGDPDNRAQNLGDLLGKILRIDPAAPADGKAYGIPPGNPYASGGGAPEIWISGARNPWRFTFDRANADLWIGDVGQNKIEEIDLLPAEPGGAGRGANLGWPYLEASAPFRGTAPAGLTPPVYEYSHAAGDCAVTGGYMYRGAAITALQGVYLFGDYCGGVVLGLAPAGDGFGERPLGVEVPQGTLASFGQDNDGELYVLSLAGVVSKIVAA